MKQWFIKPCYIYKVPFSMWPCIMYKINFHKYQHPFLTFRWVNARTMIERSIMHGPVSGIFQNQTNCSKDIFSTKRLIQLKAYSLPSFNLCLNPVKFIIWNILGHLVFQYHYQVVINWDCQEGLKRKKKRLNVQLLKKK